MKTIKSIILIFAMFFCMSFLCSCRTKEVVGPQGPQGVQGEPGKDGTSLLNGNGEPVDGLGKTGDSYINLETWDYYVKTSNGWVLEGNIKGEDGNSSNSDHDGTEGLEFYLLEDGTYGVAVGTAKYLKEVTIPSTYKNKPVTNVITSGFSNSSLETIIIPNSVTSIGNSAFSNCDSLTSIVIPNSVTSIGNWAFYDCYRLTSIVIPNSVTSIGEWAFNDCYRLTIYCESTSKPSGWSSNWNYSNRPVVFGYTIEE